MGSFAPLARRYGRSNAGNVAITAALTAPLVLMSLGLGLDFGAMALQKRKAQGTADLAAIAAAARPSDAEAIVARHFLNNGINLLVQSDSGYLTPQGQRLSLSPGVETIYDGIASIERGRYVGDAATAVGQRFIADTAGADAVRVTIVEPARVYFSGLFAASSTVGVHGTAAAQKYAAFALGSRLASVQDGLANAILGGLLGTRISLKAVDYRALADLDLNLLKVVDTLAVDLKLTALTYDELLKTDITYGQFLAALGKTGGVTPGVAAILNAVGKSLGKTALTFKLERIANLDGIGRNLVGSSDNLSLTASVLELVNAGAVAANGGNQMAADISAGLPGLASVSLKLAIGEPMVEAPPTRIGKPGSAVRTAQTRLSIETDINGLSLLAGLKIHLPLYVEVASAEARLSDIRCSWQGSSNAGVAVDVVPSVAELSLGTVNATAFNAFGSSPRVTDAKIIDSLLLKVTGKAHVVAGNVKPVSVSFTAGDIAAKRAKSVSTRDLTTSAVGSLLRNLDLNIDILGLPLATPTGVQNALATSLTPVTTALDDLIYNTLLLVGVRVGEADIRVSDVRCANPVLVQ